MAEDHEGFPEERDLKIQKDAKELVAFSNKLSQWVGKFAKERPEGLFRVSHESVYQLLHLRRLSGNLLQSSRVPVAAAVYGASQCGKSLFVGRVLKAMGDEDSPLGKSDKMSPDAYVRELSFEHDINPQSGSNEATALVTRITTKDRFDQNALPDYPIKVRALSRAEWLRVLLRGFRSECPPSTTRWEEGQIRELFELVYQTRGAEEGNREWHIDLIDAYSYAKSLDEKYVIEEAMFNAYLSEFPLSDDGYVELAGRLFWDSDSDKEVRTRISDLFRRVANFIDKVREHGKDGILIHWGAAKFLLDSQREPVQKSEESKWHEELSWTDFTDSVEDGWTVLDYTPGGRGPSEDQEVFQAAMLELVMPVIPHRLNGEWRNVVKKMDILDLPGMVAGGDNSGPGGEGRSNTAKNVEQEMMIVKRGKVFYLIDQYIQDRQIQTFLLLARGGNDLLNVKSILRGFIDSWGKTRYGDAWPRSISSENPALFVGLTGIDMEFENQKKANQSLYRNRMNLLVEHVLSDIAQHYGGENRPLTNFFPLRYPGSWDTDEERRQGSHGDGPQKWVDAKKYFLDTELIQTHVRDAEQRWDLAMQDDDGGISFVSQGFLKCTNSLQKQESLEQQVFETKQAVRNLARGWFVDPNSNQDRDARSASGKQVVDWLCDEDYVYQRVSALEKTLGFSEGDAMDLARHADERSSRSRKEPIEERFPNYLHTFLERWSTQTAPDNWSRHFEKHRGDLEGGSTALTLDDFGAFVGYLHDYFKRDEIFAQLNDRLLQVIKLPLRDQGARRHVVREYVRLILNDFVMNPGPDTEPLDPKVDVDGLKLGLMRPLVLRWKQRLPLALASAAGEHTEIPAGNSELDKIITKST